MARLSPDQFAERFGEAFTESAFRLELLDQYVAENEAEPFQLFLAGESPDPAWRAPWKRFVRSALAEGRSMARVHVVTEPLSDYTRFEITNVYPANVEAGEDVRILPRPMAGELGLPDRDFWLLDSIRVAFMEYDAEGNWLSVELSEEAETVAQSCAVRDRVMAAATPLTTYLAKKQEDTEETGHGRPHHRAS